MRRCIKYVFAMVVIWVGFGVLTQNTHAVPDEQLWKHNAITKLSETTDDRYLGDVYPCGGKEGLILLREQTSPKQACIFGTSNTVRLARYTTEDGAFAYGVAFPDEPHFTRIIGLCEGMAQCVYGQAGDRLLIQKAVGAQGYAYAVVDDFTKYLVRRLGGSPAYRFEYSSHLNYLKAGTSVLSVGVASVSSDGRWILIELLDYGLVRMDTTSGRITRIAARDSLPVSGGAVISFAISDDGRWVAAVGYADGAYIYEIDDTCGDEVTGYSLTFFSGETVSCRLAFVPANPFFPFAQRLFAPRFSSNAQQLTVYRRSGTPIKTTLTQEWAASREPRYVAFGDSFTSGEGELDDRFYLSGTNTRSNRCHVSSRSYPYLLRGYWNIVTTNLACSGSRMEGVQQANREYIQSPSGREPPTIVSLGIGGNDADFMGKLKSCIAPGVCEWTQEKYRKATAQEIRNLFPRLVSLIYELKQNYESARIFVVGYPEIINPNSEASCSPFLGILLDGQERRYMSESIRYLNQVLRAAADYTKVSFANIEEAYEGERLCDSNATAMNGVRYGDDIAPIPTLETVKLIGAESFHPTPRGHYLASVAVHTSLASFWDTYDCGNCSFEESDLEPPAYWLEGQTTDVPPRLLSKDFLNSETYQGISKAIYSFIARTFAPSSIVSFELHSEVKELGQITAADDGSLAGELKLPLDIEGYHTIHAYGTSYAGDPIDLYQTVYIASTEEAPPGSTDTASDDEPSGEPNDAQPNTSQGTTNASNGGGRNELIGGTFTDTESLDNEPIVKGAQVFATPATGNNVESPAKDMLWHAWAGVGLIVGCASFLLWWIFFTKPKL